MKRLIYVAMLMCSVLAGCTEELGEQVSLDGCNIVLNLRNSQMTKAGDEDEPTRYERELKRLDCFFYVKGETHQPCVYYHKAQMIDAVGSAELVCNVEESVMSNLFPDNNTVCDVFIIANLPNSLASNNQFESGGEGTEIPTLEKFVLDKTSGDYDAFNKQFVMLGSAEAQRYGKGNAETETISLVRAAAKVTFSVVVPESITVTENSEQVTYEPANNTLEAYFHNGSHKSYLKGDYPTSSSDLFVTTESLTFKQTGTIEGTDDAPAKTIYTCQVPLYTYARKWEKGASDAAYWTFSMKWGRETVDDDGNTSIIYDRYYYQLMINGPGLSFEPNHWYDMKVNVGVLGSSVEIEPKLIDQMSYHVVSWTEYSGTTGDRIEDVHITNYHFLEVQDDYIEMDNVETVAIRYRASHKIGVMYDRKGKKSIPSLSETTDEPALYLSNSGGAPTVVELSDVVMRNEKVADENEDEKNWSFSDNGDGILTFNYTLDQTIVYSPAYLFITIWLDENGDGIYDEKNELLTQDVTIVMYPAIYILGDESTEFSVFVNGKYNSNKSQGSNNNTAVTINNQAAGNAVGWDPDGSKYMHVISVSAFDDANDNFAFTNNGSKDHTYVLGDPRKRKPTDYDISSQWYKDGSDNVLQNYYPTSTDQDSYCVIAPKFRIASKLGGYSSSSPQGAAYRCASYQEDGYPAGRWRLPTTAEVLFVIDLQSKGLIQYLFYGDKDYFSATDRVYYNRTTKAYRVTTGMGTTNCSVRCVYDEWYWGSNREAEPNDSYPGGYEFTWKDELIKGYN